MYKIDGIPVTPSEYQMLRFVLDNEAQAGWKSTKQDIEALIQSGRNPSVKQRAEAKAFSEAMDRSYRLNEY